MSLDIDLVEDACSHCHRGEDVWEANITHNLNKMATEAGIYEAVWRPEENGFKTAGEVAAVLAPAIALMKSDPARFKKFDAPNGWGTYDDFVPWLERYLEACQRWPDTHVRSGR